MTDGADPEPIRPGRLAPESTAATPPKRSTWSCWWSASRHHPPILNFRFAGVGSGPLGARA